MGQSRLYTLGSGKRIHYCWEPQEGQTEEAQALLELIRDKLETQRYQMKKPPRNPKTLEVMDWLYEKLDPRHKSKRDENVWLMVVSNNVKFLAELARVFPPSYSLSSKQKVHNINAANLIKVIKKEDVETICPLGVGLLKNPGLLFFEEIDQCFTYMQHYRAQLSEFFGGWANSLTDVVITKYVKHWDATQKKKLFKEASVMGDLVVAYLKESVSETRLVFLEETKKRNTLSK